MPLQSGFWKEEKHATLLMLLNDHCILNDDQIKRLFDDIVRNTFGVTLPAEGATSLESTFKIEPKKKKKNNGIWPAIMDTDNPNATEMTRRQKMREDMMVQIRQAASTLGLSLHEVVKGALPEPAQDHSRQPNKQDGDSSKDIIQVAGGNNISSVDDVQRSMHRNQGAFAKTGMRDKTTAPSNDTDIPPMSSSFDFSGFKSSVRPHEEQSSMRSFGGTAPPGANVRSAKQASLDSDLAARHSLTQSTQQKVSTTGKQSAQTAASLPATLGSSTKPGLSRAHRSVTKTHSETEKHAPNNSKQTNKPKTLYQLADVEDALSDNETPKDGLIGGRPVPKAGTLNMIHYTDYKLDRRTTDMYIDRNDDIYKLGGQVQRDILIFGDAKTAKAHWFEDLMVCQKDFCGHCTTDAVARRDVTQNVLKGYPFVHAQNCIVPVPRQTGHHFQGGVVPSYDTNIIPADTWPTRVVFLAEGGEMRKVPTLMCYAAGCPQCSPPDAIEAKKARYRKGGDLYEEKERQMAARKKAQKGPQ